MGQVNVYDALQVSVVVDNIFITGFADGSMVECSKDEDNFSAKVSAQGDVGIAKTNNKLGTIKVNLAQTSPSVTFLNSLANSGKIFPIWVNSNSDVKEKIGGTKAMVKKPADASFSGEIESREYEIQVFDYTVQ